MDPSHKTISSIPLSRVELHVHLDGALRHDTIWELAKQKQVRLPGDGTFRALREALVVTQPIDLQHFLKPFLIFTPCVVGDLRAIERVAYEFCEDEALNGVAYVEARYSPHFWLSDKMEIGHIDELGQVVQAVTQGFTRGEADFGVKARSILCALNGTGTIDDVLKLSEKFRGEGVVGMDIAAVCSDGSKATYVEVPLNPQELHAYDEARKLGIHRTLHAGEAGGSEMVKRAVENYHTERVGHGYHVVDDPVVYASCREKDIHFETCPYSSLLSGSVPYASKHPIVQFAEDNVNFSLNTDDPTVTGKHLQDDYELASRWGLSEAHLVRANLNAARSCFLPKCEKDQLIRMLQKTLGLTDE